LAAIHCLAALLATLAGRIDQAAAQAGPAQLGPAQPAGAGNPATPPAERPPLVAPLDYLPEHCVAALVAQPAELLIATELEILGNVPLLGNMPIPASEIEMVVAYAVLDPLADGPNFGLILRLRHDVLQPTLVKWLAAGLEPNEIATPVADAPFPTYRSEGNFRYCAFPDRRTVVLGGEPPAAAKPAADAESAVVKKLRTLSDAGNCAAVVDAGRIRDVVDQPAAWSSGDPFVEWLLALPRELGLVAVDFRFGKQSNDVRIDLARRTDLPDGDMADGDMDDGGVLAAWAPRAAGDLDRLLRIAAEQMAGSLWPHERPELEQVTASISAALATVRPRAGGPAGSLTASAAPLTRLFLRVGEVLRPIVMSARNTARANQTRNNFRMLTLARFRYENEQGLSPTDIVGPDGKPLLSWRVRLLPYLDQEALYREFKLDEPWDGEHNRRLLEKMPAFFANPFDKQPGLTQMQGITGPQCLLPEAKRLAEIRDPRDMTIWLVEAKQPVPWTKPADVPYSDAGMYARFNPDTRGHTAWASIAGTVGTYPELADATYRCLLRINDDGVFSLGDLDPQRAAERPQPEDLRAALDAVANRVDYDTVRALIRTYRGAVGLPTPLYVETKGVFNDLMRSDDALIRRWSTLTALHATHGGLGGFDWKRYGEVAAQADPAAFRSLAEAAVLGREISAVRAVAAAARGPEQQRTAEKILQNRYAPQVAARLLTDADPQVVERAAAALAAYGTANEASALAAVPSTSPAYAAARRAVAAIEARTAAAQTEREKAALKIERGKAVAEANAAIQAGRAAEARAAILRVLNFEDRLHGPASDESLQMIDLLTRRSRQASDVDETGRLLAMKRDRLGKQLGADHWKTREAAALLDFERIQRDPAPAAAEARRRGDDALARAGKENEAKRFGAAAAAVREAVAAFEAAYGPESLGTMNARRSLRRVLAADKKFADALVEARRVHATAVALLGADHPLTVSDASEVAYITLLSGDESGAVPLLRHVAPLLEAAGKPQEAATAYQIVANKSPAEAADEADAALGNTVRLFDLAGEHAEAARASLSLARLHRARGDLAAAEAGYYDAHWRYLQSGVQGFAAMNALTDLADLYEATGRPHLELIVRQTAEQMAAPAPGRPYAAVLHASVLTRLAGTQVALGDYALAERTLERVRQLTAGKAENPFQIDAGLHLAVVKEHAGDAAAAQTILEETLAMAERVAPARRAEVVKRLAELHLRRGAAADAARAAEQAVAWAADGGVAERVDGLRLKTAALRALGKTEEAAAQYAALKDLFHRSEPTLADWRTRIEQATLALRFGEADEAARLARDALESARKAGGDEGSAHAEALAAAAPLLLRAGETAGAERASREALRLARAIVDRSAYILSPWQQIALAQAMRRSLDLRISTTLAGEGDPNELFAEIYRWKGDALIRGRELQKLRKQEAVGPFYEQLEAVTRRLAAAARATPESAAPQQAEVDRLAGIQELLESSLSASRLAYLDLEQPARVDDFTAALGDDQAFVDYFVFNRFDAANAEPEPHLLATLVRKRGASRPIDLGPLAPVREAVGVWRATTGESPAAREAGDRLRRLIWDPLAADLAPGELIYVSPDGPLGALPIFALSTTDGKYLIESYRIALVPVPRLLPAIVRSDRPAGDAGTVLALGDVDYDAELGSTAETKPAPDPASPAPGGSAAGHGAVPGTLRYVRRGEAFSPLPGTAAEVEFLQTFHRKLGLDIEVLRRGAASEATFRRRAPECRILHVATHGYFAADGVESSESAVGDTRTPAAGTPTRVFDAGLLSGLALAGANAGPVDGQDDGILTASEISVLDLGRLELAVLSACETGLGKEADGEGLLGIQRAFQVAGARSTVAGYWKVDDDGTRVLMERFYENCRTKNLGKLDALREAQLWMLDHPDEVRAAAARGLGRQVDLPATQPTDAKSPAAKRLSPRYWAAFAVSGETGPIAPAKKLAK